MLRLDKGVTWDILTKSTTNKAMWSLSLLVMSPEGHVTLQANPARTRASQAQCNGHIPSREELIKANRDMLSSNKQACDYLEEQGYMPKDTQGNKTTLMHMLLLLAHCAPHGMLPRGIRAIATILENEAATKNADTVTTNVTKRIDPLLELIKEVTDTMQGVMTQARKAADMLYSTCEDVRDEIHKAAKCAKEELQKTADRARDEMFKATEELGTVVAAVGGCWDAAAQDPGNNMLSKGRRFGVWCSVQLCSLSGGKFED